MKNSIEIAIKNISSPLINIFYTLLDSEIEEEERLDDVLSLVLSVGITILSQGLLDVTSHEKEIHAQVKILLENINNTIASFTIFQDQLILKKIIKQG